MTATDPELNRDRPRVAFVVLSFNRAANIDQIASGLRRIDDHELIVCDDGSLDGSREKWLSHLVQPMTFSFSQMTSMKSELSIEGLGSLLQRSSALSKTTTSYLVRLAGLIVSWIDSRSIPIWPLLAAFRGFSALRRPRGTRSASGEKPRFNL